MNYIIKLNIWIDDNRMMEEQHLKNALQDCLDTYNTEIVDFELLDIIE